MDFQDEQGEDGEDSSVDSQDEQGEDGEDLVWTHRMRRVSIQRMTLTTSTSGGAHRER